MNSMLKDWQVDLELKRQLKHDENRVCVKGIVSIFMLNVVCEVFESSISFNFVFYLGGWMCYEV